MTRLLTLLALLAGCATTTPAAVPETASVPEPAATETPEPATTTTPAPASAPAPLGGPTAERAAGLREAADLLEKADAARTAGNRNLAELLFSSAELITGPEAVASLAAIFRAGAPPRIESPTVAVDVNAPPQPKAVGSSEEDEPDQKQRRVRNSLRGSVVIDGKPLNDSFGVVMLEPLDRRWRPRTPKEQVIEQRDRQFAPRVMAVPVGSTVSFPNFDTIYHNVFSTSEAAKFDLGLYPRGEAREVVLEREGIVRLGCNLHAKMVAYIVVVAVPHYAITDDNGQFFFRSVRPGRYRLRAWSERSSQPVVQEITVRAGANEIDVGVADDVPAGPLPDKFGAPRGRS